MRRESIVVLLIFLLLIGAVGWIFSGSQPSPITGDSPPTLGSCSTSQSLTDSDDLLVCGKLEVDNYAHFDSRLYTYDVVYGRSGAYPMWTIRKVLDDGMHIAPGDNDGYGNNNVIIVSDNGAADDYNHSTPSTNPTLFVHSATRASSATNQWLSLTHDQTDGVIDVGTGIVKIDATVQPTGYNSSDGDPGVTQTCDAASDIVVKNGLIVSCTAP